MIRKARMIRRAALGILHFAVACSKPDADSTPASPTPTPVIRTSKSDSAHAPQQIASGEEEGEGEEVVSDFQCFECHQTQRIFGIKGPENGSLRSFLIGANAGLRLTPGLLPTAPDSFQLQLPRRGRHPAASGEDGGGVGSCVECHPIFSEGIGHGMRVYPNGMSTDECVACHHSVPNENPHEPGRQEPIRPFAGGWDCAATCHDWLKNSVTETGPTGRVYTGTLRPGALLAYSTNPHHAIWNEGYRRPGGDTSIRVSYIGPGCGGCHNLFDPSHGATPTCLDCHAWDKHDARNGPHALHLAAIGDRLPDGADMACAWCHGFAAPDLDTPRAACYNCHLSAHAPAGAPVHVALGP